MVRQKSYEGQQYRGGRKAKTKNLKKVNGGIVNKEGVFFTYEDKKALEQAVNTANRKRARMLKEAASLPRKDAGRDLGVSVGDSLKIMGKESDFILRKKSKSLQQFKTREAFDAYLANVKRVNQRNYIDIRVQQYKDNYITGLKNAFGADADELVERVKKMKNKEYMREVESDETLEIGYLYTTDDYYAKLNAVRNALGLESVEW